MCKIMVMSGIKKDKIENAWKFARVITPKLSTGNTDGFGYSALDLEGKVFGERWLDNDMALKPNGGFSPGDIKLFKALGHDSFKEKFNTEYSSFGKLNPNNIVSLMLHARAATSEKGIKNAHPFVKENTAIIHNGMIRNHAELKKEMSTCDSETILHEYLDFNVSEDTEQIEGVIESLKGYYAVGVMTKTNAGMPILDLFKSPGATLYITYVDELDTVVFCTSKYDLERALSELQWKENKILEMTGDRFFRFDAITGEKIKTIKIKSDESYTVHNGPKSLYQPDELDDVIDQHKGQVDYVRLMEEEETRRNSLAIGIN